MSKHLNAKHSAIMVGLGCRKDARQQSMEDKVIIAPNFKRDAIFWQLMTCQPLRAQDSFWFRKMVSSLSPRASITGASMMQAGLNKMEIAAREGTLKLVGDKYFGGSTDIWTGSNGNMSISFTLHIIDGGELRSIDFACEPFNVAHTGAHIAGKLKTIVTDRGLDPKRCTGITIDNAANMIKAGEILLASDEKIMTVACFCHSLQLTVHRFQGVAKVKSGSQTQRVSGGGRVGAGGAGGGNAGGAGGAGSGPPRGDSSDIKAMLTLCNEIVTTFNRSPKSTQLLKETAEWLGVRFYELQKCVPTRWWSDVTMIRSIVKNKKAIEALAMKGESPCSALLPKLDWGLLDVLLEVLRPFAAVTAAMEADKHPTIGLVLGMVCLLKKHIGDLTIHKDQAISSAAINMQTDFDQRYTLDPFDAGGTGSSDCTKLHLAAAFLNPRAKQMRRVPTDTQQVAQRIVEAIWGQLIAQKIAEEFNLRDDAPVPPDPSTDGGSEEDDAAADGAAAGGVKKRASWPRPWSWTTTNSTRNSKNKISKTWPGATTTSLRRRSPPSRGGRRSTTRSSNQRSLGTVVSAALERTETRWLGGMATARLFHFSGNSLCVSCASRLRQRRRSVCFRRQVSR
ncbi:unnamed protein product [Pylaiella littoralis]